jgi:AraC-like DNA-binding protein
MKYLKGPSELNAAFYYKWHSEELKNNLRGNNMPVHIHQSAELILVTKGRLTVSVAGKEYETVGDMQAAMILPFHPHTYRADANTEYLRCNFDTSLIPDFFNSLENREGERAVFNVDATTVFHFKKKLLEDGQLSLWSIRAFLYSALDDYLSQIPLCKSETDNNVLSLAISYMLKHKKEPLTIEKVARAIGYSRSHLSFCINRAAGMNFSTLLSMIRLDEAKTLLKTTKRSILEISMECGFGSERAFYRQFKAITGISPKDYRKNYVFTSQIEPTSPLFEKSLAKASEYQT